MARGVIIDQEACITCESCVELVPSVFKIDETVGKATPYNPEGASEDEIQEAIDICPTEAISWED